MNLDDGDVDDENGNGSDDDVDEDEDEVDGALMSPQGASSCYPGSGTLGANYPPAQLRTFASTGTITSRSTAILPNVTPHHSSGHLLTLAAVALQVILFSQSYPFALFLCPAPRERL